jgi:hypothetical protein
MDLRTFLTIPTFNMYLLFCKPFNGTDFNSLFFGGIIPAFFYSLLRFMFSGTSCVPCYIMEFMIIDNLISSAAFEIVHKKREICNFYLFSSLGFGLFYYFYLTRQFIYVIPTYYLLIFILYTYLINQNDDYEYVLGQIDQINIGLLIYVALCIFT